MAKKGWKMLRQDEFEKLTMLLKAGVKGSQVAQVTGRSITTVSFVKRANGDYAAYQESQKLRSRKYYEQRNAKTEPETKDTMVEDTHEPIPVPETPANNVRVLMALNRIGDQLERLADAWENTPGKRGLFK